MVYQVKPSCFLSTHHIACSSASRSEIVLPIMKNGECIGVLDIDSEELNQFDEMDAEYLQQLMLMIEKIV
ncbi:GAF domain-containing protein [Acinetobacter haemolyticus]|uniref:GAF domain-containing protein n=1 Tax=Acinetobacter haemolyticus TaxID=29430 RepID=UPI00224A84CA|nr:GAF domain-containing protein [Acinetobacter haemolyticus]